MSFYLNLGRAFIGSRLGPAVRRRVLPIKLTLAVTYQCNHACKLCGIWKIYREHPEKLASELSLNDYRALFREAAGSLLYLDITGGEPFLRSDLEELVDSALVTCRRLSVITLTTNGMLGERTGRTVESLARRFPACLFSVGVSLDGNREYHDRMRGKAGAYESAMATLKRLQALSQRQRNVDVKISYTLSIHSAGNFEDFFRMVVLPSGLNISDVTFNVEHSGLLYQNDKVQDADAQRAASFHDNIARDVKFILNSYRQAHLSVASRMKSFYRSMFLRNIGRHFREPGRMLFHCHAGLNSAYIDPYGAVFPCIIWDKQLGNVRQGLRNALQSEAANRARALIRRGECPVCWNACELIPSLLTSWRMPLEAGKALIRQA